MTPITPAILLACGVGQAEADLFAPFFGPMLKRFSIWLPAAQAAFVAQAMHESSRFKHLEEDLFYRTAERIQLVYGKKRFPNLNDAAPLIGKPEALANVVYANRLGNGDESSGDGWRFRGRGIFQLTGRANYRVHSDALGQNFLKFPELVSQPEGAVMTAGLFWSMNGCNAAMAGGDFDRTTRLINGPAMAGAAERRALFEITRQVVV